MNCYRLKHLPTGLYYTTYTEKWVRLNGRQYRVKSNLSKRGKVFMTKPNLDSIKHFRNHLHIEGVEGFDRQWARARAVDFNKNEWVVETSTVLEQLTRTQIACSINP